MLTREPHIGMLTIYDLAWDPSKILTLGDYAEECEGIRVKRHVVNENNKKKQENAWVLNVIV